MARTSVRRRQKFSFAYNQDTVVRRSTFHTQPIVMTTFNAGIIKPVKFWEVLPGDTYQIKMRQLTRLWTPIVPFMDNIRLKVYYFFVPNRIVWQNWEKFMGDHGMPDEEVATDYIIPTISGTFNKNDVGELFESYGIPVVPGANTNGSLKYGTDYPLNALLFRGYNLIYNEWFRREWIITDDHMPEVPLGDGPDDKSIYKLLRRAKRLDYFTGCNPFPQAGPQVTLPLGGSAPVVSTGEPIVFSAVNAATANPQWQMKENSIRAIWESSGIQVDGNNSFDPDIPVDKRMLRFGSVTGLETDTSGVTGVNVNDIRQLIQLQRFYEKLARGGGRYTEVIRAFFGVFTGDARLQRPEYLGGGEVMLYVNPVAQTSASGDITPQGNLAAFAVAHGKSGGFLKTFTEHGFIHCFVVAYTDQTYQQGLDRALSRQHWTDFYWPTFAHLGEQAVLNKEIFCQGTADDNKVFGYQERYAEYRYDKSIICGQFRSTAPQPLDVWHLAQKFDNLPKLSQEFIEENPPVDRVIALLESGNTPQFFGQFGFDVKATRPIPTYGTPGFVDHF